MLCNFFPDIEYVLIIDYKKMKIFLIEKTIVVIIVKKYKLFSHLLGLTISNSQVVTNIV